MSWTKGFNFRGTSSYVTDGANDTYVVNDLYPTTRNGVTFGWETLSSIDEADRSTGVDVRLAGINYFWGGATSLRNFWVDLPATGDYEITLALGDQAGAKTNNKIVFKDTTTVLATVNPASQSANEWADATGALLSGANWPASNTPLTKTFATTRFTGQGDQTGNSQYFSLAHISLNQVTAGSATVKQLAALGVG